MDSPSYTEDQDNVLIEAEHQNGRSRCLSVAEQASSQILGELQSAINAVEHLSSSGDAARVHHHPNRCSML